MANMRRMAKRFVEKLPPKLQRPTKKAGKKLVSSLPGAVQLRLRPGAKSKTRKNATTTNPIDPLQLATSVSNAKTNVMIGRAAGGMGRDPEAPERLYRALYGESHTNRSIQGGRLVGGIFGRDLREGLEKAGHVTVPFLPGTSECSARRVEVVLIDLSGFGGVWAGSLDATGVGLVREIVLSIRAAQEHGAMCWVVVRGDSLHKLGALALQTVDGVQPVIPGTDSIEQSHFTENPGPDAPAGVLDIVRALEVKA